MLSSKKMDNFHNKFARTLFWWWYLLPTIIFEHPDTWPKDYVIEDWIVIDSAEQNLIYITQLISNFWKLLDLKIMR